MKQGSGSFCYEFRHTEYRKLWKMYRIQVAVVKGHMFVKSTLRWIYLQRDVCHAHEVAGFFFPRHKVCMLNFIFCCALVSNS